MSKENSTMVPCIYTNTTFCDAGEGVAAKVAAGRGGFIFSLVLLSQKNINQTKEYQPKKTFSINLQSLMIKVILAFCCRLHSPQALWLWLFDRLFDIPVGLRASSSGQFLRRSVLQEESYTVPALLLFTSKHHLQDCHHHHHQIHHQHQTDQHHHQRDWPDDKTFSGGPGQYRALWVWVSNVGSHSLPPCCLDHHLPLSCQGIKSIFI